MGLVEEGYLQRVVVAAAYSQAGGSLVKGVWAAIFHSRERQVRTVGYNSYLLS